MFEVRIAVSALGWNWIDVRRPSMFGRSPEKEMLGLVILSVDSPASGTCS